MVFPELLLCTKFIHSASLQPELGLNSPVYRVITDMYPSYTFR
jgi:hypothetical protein